MIRKTLVTFAAAFTLAGGSLAFSAAPASAGHCADNGGSGHSDFATHARNNAGTVDEEGNRHNEGGHKGWSTCEENSKNFAG